MKINITEDANFNPKIEYWRPCPEPYSGYEVSTFGNVKESKKEIYAIYENGCQVLIKIIPEKPIRPYLNNSNTDSNYYMVSLKNENNHQAISIHRLVAMCFLNNNLDKKYIVNHKDGNLKNNHVLNLEYISYDKYIKQNKEKYTPKLVIYTPIKCVTTGQYFTSIKSVSEYYNISYGKVKNKLYNKSYKWDYTYDFILVSKKEVKDYFLKNNNCNCVTKP